MVRPHLYIATLSAATWMAIGGAALLALGLLRQGHPGEAEAGGGTLAVAGVAAVVVYKALRGGR